MFKALNFTEEQAQSQFGFLIDSFRFGAPPPGGIAFPKNNAGRDTMLPAPTPIAQAQLDELNIDIKKPQ